MSHHHHEKKHKKLLQLFRNRHTLQVNQLAETLERGRELEQEREEELRESAVASSRAAAAKSGDATPWSAKMQDIRNKNTGRTRMANERWNRFAGTEGGGGRGL